MFVLTTLAYVPLLGPLKIITFRQRRVTICPRGHCVRLDMSKDAEKEPGESKYEGRIVFDVSRRARSGKRARNENGERDVPRNYVRSGREMGKGVEGEEGEREREGGRKHESVFAEFESRGVDNCEPANVGKSRREETKFR